MHRVTPRVFLVGETQVVQEGLAAFLTHAGVPEWTSDAPSDSERMVEVMGRLCYRSWEPGLNPNVTKVREHNSDYVANILKTAHGSVLEHAVLNFIFADVSRVFTHELVRHRVGTAFSQESLRYVRLEDLGLWLPTVIQEDDVAVTIFAETFGQLEQLQLRLAAHFRLDDEGVPFSLKKVITSAMRRIAPIGLATAIGFSANIRTLRWLLQLRTAPTAEEEIRLVFGQVGEILVARYPNAFGDFTVTTVDGLPCYTAPNAKA
ncbi:thymidylate synthase, flavin-dependent [candidate division WWE3 bacterium RIFCSPLOWO2_01_FULL_42_11]|uniref:FAD-dependent thymidylate synthase n=1 Tax=candidate division WWE3 bacterium RIFCSPLOWO2_01_FULL_42_11 TaxID=1802627 RepID=A0A1F4VPM0_UNCKA|nr:MAG: thymidylate synthase, flavin-dependent [candidate division WWE3 bacterium RIFCSPLOWO2_01_FULL_42_11]